MSFYPDEREAQMDDRERRAAEREIDALQAEADRAFAGDDLGPRLDAEIADNNELRAEIAFLRSNNKKLRAALVRVRKLARIIDVAAGEAVAR